MKPSRLVPTKMEAFIAAYSQTHPPNGAQHHECVEPHEHEATGEKGKHKHAVSGSTGKAPRERQSRQQTQQIGAGFGDNRSPTGPRPDPQEVSGEGDDGKANGSRERPAVLRGHRWSVRLPGSPGFHSGTMAWLMAPGTATAPAGTRSRGATARQSASFTKAAGTATCRRSSHRASLISAVRSESNSRTPGLVSSTGCRDASLSSQSEAPSQRAIPEMAYWSSASRVEIMMTRRRRP